MSRRLVLFLSIALTVLSLATMSRAQCQSFTRTGCPGGGAATCSGAPRIGTRLIITCPPCQRQLSFNYLGTFPMGRVTLPSPPMCVSGCLLGCVPLVFGGGGTLVLPIPNDRQLVNARFCVSCGCIDPARGCVFLQQTLSVTIQA